MNATRAQQFREQGCVVVPAFRDATAIAAVRDRAAAIIDSFDPAGVQAIFTTQEQERRVNDYFLGSANTIRCFFEEEAFDEHGHLRQSKALSINKIGHALHDLDPVFDPFSHGQDLADLAAYTLHATDARTIYSPSNWLQRDDSLPLRGFV